MGMKNYVSEFVRLQKMETALGRRQCPINNINVVDCTGHTVPSQDSNNSMDGDPVLGPPEELLFRR